MLERFLTLKADVARDLRAALAEGATREAELLAHGMIAAAGTIGATRLSEVAFALQGVLRDGPPERTAPLVDAFEAALGQVLDGLKS